MSRPIEGLPLQPGDIAATRGTGPLGWLSKNLLDPETDRYHHMIIGGWVRSQQDWVVYESIGKGVAIGYLGALYTGQELEVYRLSTRNAQEIGEDVVDILPYYGRAHYDYLLPMKLAVGALECFVKQITGERTLRRKAGGAAVRSR